jgi:hypothetical protein
MFLDMSQATNWTRFGTVTQQIAAKLIELREVRNKRAVAPEILNSATAVAPVEEERGIEGSRNRGKGLAGRDPIQRPASAGPVRKAMQASGGK